MPKAQTYKENFQRILDYAARSNSDWLKKLDSQSECTTGQKFFKTSFSWSPNPV